MKMKGFWRPNLLHILQPAFRGFSTTSHVFGVEKALLSKLRKQTGLPLINCKKALEKFDNDFSEAKKWIEEEALKAGWAKATKLMTRPMSQGLVAVVGDTSQVTMLEVNCETDFVAKNEQFIAMVTQLAQECKSHFEKQTEKMIYANKEELSKISSLDEGTLADILARNVGNLGENMALRRGVYFRADDDSHLSSYVHPSGKTSECGVQLGKYGTLVEMVQRQIGDTQVLPVEQLGSSLCQHIIGMNPTSLGQFIPNEVSNSSEDSSSSSSDDERAEDAVKEAGSTSEENQEDLQADEQLEKVKEEDQTELLKQGFLLDSSVTVGQLVHENGVEVKRFVRYHCGEELEVDKES